MLEDLQNFNYLIFIYIYNTLNFNKEIHDEFMKILEIYFY